MKLGINQAIKQKTNQRQPREIYNYTWMYQMWAVTD